ncbi:MAG: hypothetical protein QG663_1281, partial [Thermodesulfobacteriota bacterium]|nr:hypothetical protein [Thermodesulfobacteriota bacterium]
HRALLGDADGKDAHLGRVDDGAELAHAIRPQIAHRKGRTGPYQVDGPLQQHSRR